MTALAIIALPALLGMSCVDIERVYLQSNAMACDKEHGSDSANTGQGSAQGDVDARAAALEAAGSLSRAMRSVITCRDGTTSSQEMGDDAGQ